MFKRSLLLALAVTLVTTGAVSAATWYGDYDTDFMNPLNWDTMAVPVDNIVIKAVPIGPVSNECTISTNATATYGGGFVIQNGGVFNINCPGQGGGGTPTGFGFQAGGTTTSNSISNGTLNIGPSTVTTFRTWTLYVGNPAGLTGTLNILPGGGVNMANGGTLSVGGSNSGSVGSTGIINQWGRLDFNALRLRWNNIGNYTWTLYPGCQVYGWVHATYNTTGDYTAQLNAGIAEGRIVSGAAGYIPVVDYNSVDLYTFMTVAKAYKATIPSPANNSTVAGMNGSSQSIILSWMKPLPEDVNDPVTSDVYFGTDPNSLAQVEFGISGNSTSQTVNKLTTYYWRVDSTDPNRNDYDPNLPTLTVGDQWTFNTNNTAAAVAISAPYQTTAGDVALWLPGNTSATINSTVTDDGYPLGGTTSYLWQRQNLDTGADPNWYDISSTSSCNTPTYNSVAGAVSDNYNYRLTYNDGEFETVRNFLVRVFPTTCIAAPRLPGYVALTGEFSADCMVSFIDFATLANNWGLCNAVGEVCN